MTPEQPVSAMRSAFEDDDLLLAKESVQRSATLGDQVYAILCRGLLMGAWKPDERLSVRELAQELAVGRWLHAVVTLQAFGDVLQEVRHGYALLWWRGSWRRVQ